KWSRERMRGILAVEDAPVVSSDIIGTEHSAILSSIDTQVIGGRFVKVLAWYDNEWAFSRRCVDMMSRM
ncbi:MAG: type I glyceraldehyde-3-phosphate dehydrogenase, partial [Myxococcota bacterium]